jgi:hypothetical protein
VWKSAVRNAKVGREDELDALRRLDVQSRALESQAAGPSFEAMVAEERERSHAYGAALFLVVGPCLAMSFSIGIATDPSPCRHTVAWT